jgi:hypothetical protein
MIFAAMAPGAGVETVFCAAAAELGVEPKVVVFTVRALVLVPENGRHALAPERIQMAKSAP